MIDIRTTLHDKTFMLNGERHNVSVDQFGGVQIGRTHFVFSELIVNSNIDLSQRNSGRARFSCLFSIYRKNCTSMEDSTISLTETLWNLSVKMRKVLNDKALTLIARRCRIVCSSTSMCRNFGNIDSLFHRSNCTQIEDSMILSLKKLRSLSAKMRTTMLDRTFCSNPLRNKFVCRSTRMCRNRDGISFLYIRRISLLWKTWPFLNENA